jgi:HEAT repeat protein
MQVRLAGSVLLMLCTLASAMRPAKTYAAGEKADWSADIQLLESSDPLERAKAALALADACSAPGSDKIVEGLVKELSSNAPAARYEAAKLLAEFCANGNSAVPALIELLKKDSDPTVRAAAARSLGYLADPKSDAVPALVKAIVDKDPRVRRNAVAAIHRIHPGPTVVLPLVVPVLSDADPATVAQALASVSELGEKVVPAMIEGLKNEKARYWALLVLADIGPAAKGAVPEIKKALSDSKVEVAMQAALTLAAIGPDAKDASPELIAALDNPSNAVRFGAAYALGKIDAKDAAPALEKMMAEGKSQFLRAVCAWALVELNPHDAALADRALKLLGEALKSDDARVRRGAVKGLSELKVSPDRVAPLLIPALGDKDPQIVEIASLALAKAGPKFAADIAAGLSDEKSREGAVRTLGRLGAGAKDAAPAIAAALKDAPPAFKRELLFALAMIGPDSATTVAQATAAMKDASPDVQRAAIYALGKMGPAAKDAIPALRENLKSDDHFLRMVSIWALLQIEGKNPGLVALAVPVLIDALKSDHELRRLEAARALGGLGPAAIPALPLLKELSESDSPEVRKAAADAVAQITGGPK